MKKRLQYLRCDPTNPKADIRGCVFDLPSDAEQLAILRREYDECTNAWVTMLLPSLLQQSDDTQAAGTALEGLDALEHVGRWQQRMVTHHVAADPAVCLMDYCAKVIGGAIRQIETRMRGNSPVAQGPGIKIRSSETPPRSPDDHYRAIGGNAVQIFGGVDAHGDRTSYVASPIGLVYAQSEYEIHYDPASGLTAYLLDGALSYLYPDPLAGTLQSAEIAPGQMLQTDADGTPLSITAFDPTTLEDWWSEAPYLVTCPANAHQEGPDCICNDGFYADPYSDFCVPGAAPPPAVEPAPPAEAEPALPADAGPAPAPAAETVAEPVAEPRSQAETTRIAALVVVGLGAAGAALLVIVAVLLAVRRRG